MVQWAEQQIASCVALHGSPRFVSKWIRIVNRKIHHRFCTAIGNGSTIDIVEKPIACVWQQWSGGGGGIQSRDSLVIQLNAFETELVKSKFESILIGNQVTHMSEKVFSSRGNWIAKISQDEGTSVKKTWDKIFPSDSFPQFSLENTQGWRKSKKKKLLVKHSLCNSRSLSSWLLKNLGCRIHHRHANLLLLTDHREYRAKKETQQRRVYTYESEKGKKCTPPNDGWSNQCAECCCYRKSLTQSPPSPDGFHRKIFPFAFYTHFTPKETAERTRGKAQDPY